MAASLSSRAYAPAASSRDEEKTRGSLRPSAPPALTELDDKLASGGLLLVEVPTAARDAWMAHVERRLRAMYREVFLARAGVASPVWSRLATQLGGALDADARRLARTVTTLLGQRNGAIVAALGTSSWDRAVTAEIARVARERESQRDEADGEGGGSGTAPAAATPTVPIVLFVTDAGEIGLDAERWTAPADPGAGRPRRVVRRVVGGGDAARADA